MKFQLSKSKQIRLVEIGLEAVNSNPERFAKFCEEFEQEQRRKTMLKNKDKTNEGDNLKAMELIESTQHQLKEIHLYYGVLKDTEEIKRIKNNEIKMLVDSIEKTLRDKHHYSDEQIKGINWDIDPKEHERFREWCARTGNDFHRYETLDKYLNL
jgi:DNA replicative helicase MCM subunit Mcm2 (Cdc46/Mcm family)